MCRYATRAAVVHRYWLGAPEAHPLGALADVQMREAGSVPGQTSLTFLPGRGLSRPRRARHGAMRCSQRSTSRGVLAACGSAHLHTRTWFQDDPRKPISFTPSRLSPSGQPCVSGPATTALVHVYDDDDDEDTYGSGTSRCTGTRVRTSCFAEMPSMRKGAQTLYIIISDTCSVARVHHHMVLRSYRRSHIMHRMYRAVWRRSRRSRPASNLRLTTFRGRWRSVDCHHRRRRCRY